MYKLKNGFSLIELMIVVTIIGILGAVAIPSYSDYTARAQVTEAISLTAAFKTGTTEYYSMNAVWPVNLTAVGSTTSGKFVESVTFTDDGAAALSLIATMKNTGVNSGIAGSTFVTATTDGGKSWTCNNGSILNKYLPGSCK